MKPDRMEEASVHHLPGPAARLCEVCPSGVLWEAKGGGGPLGQVGGCTH